MTFNPDWQKAYADAFTRVLEQGGVVIENGKNIFKLEIDIGLRQRPDDGLDERLMDALLAEEQMAALPHVEDDEDSETCMRCGVVLDTEEGIDTGICAGCWDPETDGDY